MRVKVITVVHPKDIMRGQWGKEMFQVRYLRRVRECIYGQREWNLVDVNQAPPKANLFPTLNQILSFLADSRTKTEGVAIDLEAAGPYPRCLGLMLTESEEYICIHFRRQGGGVYWSYTELCTITEKLYYFLRDPDIPKIYQNGQQYDIPELEALGFEVNGYAEGGFDTLIGHRYMYGESPADLQTLGIAYGGLPAWKKLVKEDEEAENK